MMVMLNKFSIAWSSFRIKLCSHSQTHHYSRQITVMTANLDGEPNSIDLKYLVKGHRFMRPNAINEAIGNKLKKKGDVHD